MINNSLKSVYEKYEHQTKSMEILGRSWNDVVLDDYIKINHYAHLTRLAMTFAVKPINDYCWYLIETY